MENVECIEYVDVWVCGDGITWSCQPSQLYRIPTELFNYNMMIGALDNEYDLQMLIGKVSKDNVKYEDYTDVYVGADKNWSGLPSVLYQIPSDVFDYLQKKGNTEKTIGRLESQDDLHKLIELIRFEMKNGIVEAPQIIPYTKPLNDEMKTCGHMCTISCIKDVCCKCSDIRPIREEGTYPSYVDGEGYRDCAMRNEFYCPICK